MKRKLLLVFLLATALAACTNATGLARLERMLRDFVGTVNDLDNVAEVDLAEGNTAGLIAPAPATAPLAFGQSNDDIIYTAMRGHGANPASAGERMRGIQNLHQEIREQQQLVFAARTNIRLLYEEFKALRNQFDEAGLELTPAEQDLIDDYIAQGKDARATLRGTIGKVFRPMARLRGCYRFDNADLLEETITAAKEQIAIRLQNINLISDLLEEINTMLRNRLSEAALTEPPIAPALQKPIIGFVSKISKTE